MHLKWNLFFSTILEQSFFSIDEEAEDQLGTVTGWSLTFVQVTGVAVSTKCIAVKHDSTTNWLGDY